MSDINRKILIIGSSGSMGRRYCSVAEWLGLPHDKIDIDNYDKLEGVKKNDYLFSIIATPTDSHYEICRRVSLLGVPFLCEKPLSKKIDECKEIKKIAKECFVDGFVVNNWAHTCHVGAAFMAGKNSVVYDYYNTGKDGFYWDCCQLIYLSKNPALLSLDNHSPIFTASIAGERVTMEDIAYSYTRMIVSAVNFFTYGVKKELLWTLEDGESMTRKVIEYQEGISSKC